MLEPMQLKLISIQDASSSRSQNAPSQGVGDFCLLARRLPRATANASSIYLSLTMVRTRLIFYSQVRNLRPVWN